MLPDRLKLFFDGAITVNPGGIATYAWYLEDVRGQIIRSGQGEACRGEGASNNVAEWTGLTMGLRWLNRKRFTGSLAIYGDSQVVLWQLVGKYKTCKPHMAVWRDECRKILNNCQCEPGGGIFSEPCQCVGWEWSATWIPREDNIQCDAMSR